MISYQGERWTIQTNVPIDEEISEHDLRIFWHSTEVRREQRFQGAGTHPLFRI